MKKIFTSGALALLAISLTAPVEANQAKMDQATYDQLTEDQKEAHDKEFMESDEVDDKGEE
jgi:hypothetical protein